MAEDMTWNDVLAAEREEDKIWAEIDQVLKSTLDRKAAEKKFLTELAPRMDEAMKKSRAAFDKWLQETQDLMKETEILSQEEP